uniref:SDR family NAD(P)-dependent oxidoreductase n=1 Tax=Rhizobium sp. F40D2 TaxID=3453141 RepID=UPI003F2274A6
MLLSSDIRYTPRYLLYLRCVFYRRYSAYIFSWHRFCEGVFHEQTEEVKVAVVIGGGSGALARPFRGALCEGRRERLRHEPRKVSDEEARGRQPLDPGSIQPVRADAGNLDDLAAVFEHVRAERGRIDILVLNAGISEYSVLGSITTDHFDRIFAERPLVVARPGRT